MVAAKTLWAEVIGFLLFLEEAKRVHEGLRRNKNGWIGSGHELEKVEREQARVSSLFRPMGSRDYGVAVNFRNQRRHRVAVTSAALSG